VANGLQTDSDSDGSGDACATQPVGKICQTQTSKFSGIKPNIYLLLDVSSSMTGTPLQQAKTGLDQVAQALAPAARIGLSTYPTGGQCSAWEQLPIGDHSVNQIQTSYNNISANGGTPTGTALYEIRNQQLLDDPSDPKNGQRPKAVVLITDGNPNDCEGVHPTLDEIDKLHKQGIDVYIVSFQGYASHSFLNRMATKGGTDAPGRNRFYSANNSSGLVTALNGISSKIVPCSFNLNSQPPAPSKIWVSVDGTPLQRGPSGGYTYEPATNTLKLSPSACQQLRSAAVSQSAPLKITFGCPTQCQPNPEVCDYRDNDCDGEVDEGCGDCTKEVCDGVDNDCDGLVDEGCNKCRAEGDPCRQDWECCSQSCQNGACQLP
jgi:uncharacterized protein YegL